MGIVKLSKKPGGRFLRAGGRGDKATTFGSRRARRDEEVHDSEDGRGREPQAGIGTGQELNEGTFLKQVGKYGNGPAS